MNRKYLLLVLASLAVVCPNLVAQHLWWNLEGQRDATCLYGEITVLATAPGIYYCGANWHPGELAGGYCGIQHNGIRERRTIFSIWDTSPQLHPTTTEADRRTIFNRFGGEGEGSHTHMLWPWKTNETFQFFVQKQPGSQADTTDTRYYVTAVKVFILAGQSNMEGYGGINTLAELGEHPTHGGLLKNLFPHGLSGDNGHILCLPARSAR
jgi:hypothetical protein